MMNRPLDQMTSEELGLLLGQQFEQAFLSQQNIHAITAELQRRQSSQREADTDAADEG